ncbi:MAG: group II intron reverse transcriptase/maturase [Thermoguttaceae bacterium]|nr:group II intron reverse transcriptase/maturase [Thermoguttaceae bacterium]
MRLIDQILSKENMLDAIESVKRNKGAAGIDKVTVGELDEYFRQNWSEMKTAILARKYEPQPVRRVYIPKSNGELRPLGIPAVADRVIQQAIAQELVRIVDSSFSKNSHGFRPQRSCHSAMDQVLQNLNDGYEWVIDLDIEKYFDTVNHDKLISILREQVNKATTLNLIRRFLKAGVMENGVFCQSSEGVPQGGPLSPILSNIYLDKLDKELESRGLRFVRYADDVVIFVKSEMAANRVMKSVVSWLERKLFLKVSATKTKIVRPSKSEFLGFGIWKSGKDWKCRPLQNRRAKLYKKCKDILCRKKATARPLAVTFTKLNQVIRGWINYYRIGNMKTFLEEFGQWLRHKVRVVIIKQWKRPRTIYRNLMRLNQMFKCSMTDEDIFKVANSRRGWYRRCATNTVNYLLSPKLLETANEKRERPGLINPLNYYLEELQ